MVSVHNEDGIERLGGETRVVGDAQEGFDLRQAFVLRTFAEAGKALVVDAKTNEKLQLSIRNMADHQYLPPEGVNVYDLLRHDHLIVTKDAAKALEARCLK